MSKGLHNRAGNDPRAASLVALGEVLRKRRDSQAALDRQLEESLLVPTDKGLCTELFYGTLRHHMRLEWFLRRKLSRFDKLPDEMMLVLEQALYELMHTRVPDHAAVNWAVNLVGHRFGPGLSKVANGVLRGAVRGKKEEYENPSFYAAAAGVAENSATVAALLYAVPVWIADLWFSAYGPEDACLFLRAGLGPAAQAVRVNSSRPEKDEVIHELQAQNARLLPPACWSLQAGSRFPLRDWQSRGLVSRQSPASYEALFRLAPQNWPEPLWDACAGRGNKTLALLESGIAVRVASDPAEKRVKGLESELTRLHLPPVPLFEHECEGNACCIDFEKLDQARKSAIQAPEVITLAAAEAGFENLFGTVLVDAPCSGLGTLSHRPEIRWRRTPGDIQKLLATQSDILESAHKALLRESGNRIIYMTCTLNPAENREQADKFLAAHPGYRLAQEFQTPADSPLAEFFYAAELVI